MIFEAIIIDDEAPARVELKNQLERTGRVKVVAEAVCLQEGVDKMQRNRIDVAFVDHNISGSNTSILPDALPTMAKVPMLIYMTAFADVQDDPFGVDPMDYLVKPVDEEKLDRIVGAIEERYAKEVCS